MLFPATGKLVWYNEILWVLGTWTLTGIKSSLHVVVTIDPEVDLGVTQNVRVLKYSVSAAGVLCKQHNFGIVFEEERR